MFRKRELSHVLFGIILFFLPSYTKWDQRNGLVITLLIHNIIIKTYKRYHVQCDYVVIDQRLFKPDLICVKPRMILSIYSYQDDTTLNTR